MRSYFVVGGAAGGVDFVLSEPLPAGTCGAEAGFSGGALVLDLEAPPVAGDAEPLVVVRVVFVLPGTAGPVAVVLVPTPGFVDPAKPFPGEDSTLTDTMQSRIQNAATPIVILVKRSPAFAPKALWPPMPPSAPAKPPPRPRCNKTMRIKNAAVTISKNPSMNPIIDIPATD
jgi:hypothetical protein